MPLLLGSFLFIDYGTDASTNPSTHLSYTFISPDETSKNLIASRIPYLDSLEPMSVLFSNTKHSNLSGRKSLKSLPIPAGYGACIDSYSFFLYPRSSQCARRVSINQSSPGDSKTPSIVLV